MGLAVIVLSNIFLVQVNSSNNEFVYKSLGYLKKDNVMWGVSLGTLLGLGIILYTPLSKILNLAALSLRQVLLVIIISIVAVMWYELVKLYKIKNIKM